MFRNINMPLIIVLFRIDRHGVLINTEILTQHSRELMVQLAKLEIEVHKLSVETFNYQVVARIFYDKL